MHIEQCVCARHADRAPPPPQKVSVEKRREPWKREQVWRNRVRARLSDNPLFQDCDMSYRWEWSGVNPGGERERRHVRRENRRTRCNESAWNASEMLNHLHADPQTPSNASLSVQARRARIRKEIYRRGPIRRCRRSRMATPFPIPAKHILPDPYAPHIEKLSKVDGPLLARTFP